MSTYAIRPVSSLDDIVKSYVDRKFQVVLVSKEWSSVQALSKRMGVPSEKGATMVISSLARKVYERSKSGSDTFPGPTLVLFDETDSSLDSIAWHQIQQAARNSSHEVVFVHLSAG